MPKLALVSDIHANLPALQAVMEQLEKKKPDIWICLGDIVGYGPHPKECIDEVIRKEMICVMGNHDAGVTGKISLNHFREPNKRLIQLTRELISDDQLKWLSSLPLIREDENQEWVASHASPKHPEKWEYIESAFKVRNLLPDIEQNLCFVGHTHRPAFVSDTIGMNSYKKGHKYFINPGSVGQSRDGDLRASCAFIDTDNFEYENIRTRYAVNSVLRDLENLNFSLSEAEKMLRVQG